KVLQDYLKIIEGTNDTINNGLQIVGKEQLVDEFTISESEWNKLTKQERTKFSEKFKIKYTRKTPSSTYGTPLIFPKNLVNFSVTEANTYLGNISNFQRTRNQRIYSEPKIIINRTGKQLKAAYIKERLYYNFDIYSIFLKESRLNYFITALINSYLLNYFVDLVYRKRADGSFPKIGYDAIKNIPIPNELDDDLIKQISKIGKDLTEAKYKYSDGIAHQLNELIFDLYDLSYIEKQRIRDYFRPKTRATNTKNELENYKSTLTDTLSMYFKNEVDVEFSDTNFNLIVAKISLNKNKSVTPGARKTKYGILNEIFEQNSQENFLASQEKIYGRDCVYIIHKDENTSWSETKAFEDGQDILKHIR
ncbi:MAG TPA: TaqI-like C-terminal specificity domain-containing protein, partial [Hanamia sp.]|nr:TaqI-like C-terminal specificity domain-containing protein [Hanamia sp.]